MKHLVALYIAFFTGTVTLAQQPNEWHPALAEDNKSATLGDTFAFLKGIAMTSENMTVPHGGEIFTLSFDVNAKCTLHLAHGLRDGLAAVNVESVQLDFSQIDPLLVTVKTNPEPGHIPFFVVLTGTNNAKIVAGERASYSGDDYRLSRPYQQMSAVPVPCKEGKHKGKSGNEWIESEFGNCKSIAVSDYVFSFPFGDQETAKRFARGAMHAALLCGGTKAVSPF